MEDNTGELQIAILIVKKAMEEDQKGNLTYAESLYGRALDRFEAIERVERNPQNLARLQESMKGYYERQVKVRREIDRAARQMGPNRPQTTLPSRSGGPNGPRQPQTRSFTPGARLDSLFPDPAAPMLRTSQPSSSSGRGRGELSEGKVSLKANVRWEDIVGHTEAKNCLFEAVILPLRLPSLFHGKRQPWRGILLYGPRGCGKSTLAAALATEVGGTFYHINTTALMNNRYGEGNRAIKQFFDLALDSTPSVIFIDEIDAITNIQGSESATPKTRGMKAEFLAQIQRISMSNKRVLVVAATNLPWLVDRSVLNSFEKGIFIGLSDSLGRKMMLRTMIDTGHVEHTLSEPDLNRLVDATNGRSGHNLDLIGKAALSKPLHRLAITTHFRFDNGKWYMATPETPNAIRMRCQDIPEDLLPIPPVTYQDFLDGIHTSRRTVPTEDLNMFDSFRRDGWL